MERFHIKGNATSPGLNLSPNPDGDWVKAADAQAAIAALQARVQELEKNRDKPIEQVDPRYWDVNELRANVELKARHIDEIQSQLTQRTAERDTARRRVDELEAREVDVVMLREDLEQRTAELEAANKLLYKKNCELGRFETIISDLQAELERVRSLVEALPKVEGEVTVRDITALCWANDGTYGSINCKEQLVSLLKHRQGMEGSHE